MVSSEGRCGVSIDQRLPPSGRKRPRKQRSQAVELTWPRWPPVCLWKSLYLQQMTHHGNLCCSAAAVLLLTYDSHFSSPPDFVIFLWFSNTSSVSSPFLFHLLSSLSSLLFFICPLPLPCYFSFVWVCLFLCLSLFSTFFLPLLFPVPTPFQVSECNWPSRQAPSLHNLFAVCKNMHNWLKQNPKNVCVITCSVRRR